MRSGAALGRGLGQGCRRAFLGAALAVLAPLPAWGQQLELEWVSPSGCGSEAELRREVERLLGRSPDQALTAVLRVKAEVESQSQGGYRLQVHLGAAVRELHANSCPQVLEAAGILVALAIEPGPSPHAEARRPAAPPAAPIPAPPIGGLGPEAAPEPPWFWLLRVEGALAFGALPTASGGPGLASGLAHGPWQLELGASYFLPQSTSVAGNSGRFWAADLALVGCRSVLEGDLPSAVCLGPGLTLMQGVGPGLQGSDEGLAAYPTLQGGLRISFPLAQGFSGVAQGAVGLVPLRPRFVLLQGPVMHQPAPVTGRLSLGIEFRGL